MSDTKILTHITEQFHQATTGWHDHLFPIANHLFMTLAIIEITWSAIWWTLEKQEANSLIVEFLKKIVSIGMFYALLLNAPTWMNAAIQSFAQAGMLAGGHGQSHLYPSDVMSQGISIAGYIFKSFHDTGVFSFGIGTVVGWFAGCLVLLAFTMIAGLLVVTLVESYIVLSAGILFLGFASNRMSSKFAVNYISYAMSVGAKLFMLYLVIGIGSSIADGWVNTMSQLKDANIDVFLEISGCALVYVFIAWAIPHKAESLMSGSTSASLGGLVAAASIAKGAADLAGGAAKTIGGAASAGFQAVKQATAISKGLGGGIKGMAAGAIGAAANLAASGASSLLGGQSAASSMSQKTEKLKTHFAEREETRAANKPASEAAKATKPPSGSDNLSAPKK